LEDVDWNHLAQVPQTVENFLTSRVTIGFSRRTPLHIV
jgi:hypothetical protein